MKVREFLVNLEIAPMCEVNECSEIASKIVQDDEDNTKILAVCDNHWQLVTNRYPYSELFHCPNCQCWHS